MTDEQLRQTAPKGLANPEHLAELLQRTDLPLDRLQDVRTNLASAITFAKISTEALQRFISQLKSATSLDEFDQILAELCHTNQLVHSGVVANNSPIITSAKLGRQYNLSLTLTQIDPVPEADALYLGTDGLIHLDEVKNTAQALRQKLNRHPEQLQRMLQWRAKAPDKREIRMIITTEAGWTQVFAARRGEKAILKSLINEGVPLTIGRYKLSVPKMADLWNATETKVYQMFEQGTWSNWNDFYSQMLTPKEAESFLGVNLQ